MFSSFQFFFVGGLNNFSVLNLLYVILKRIMYIYNYSFTVIVVIDSIYIPYHFLQIFSDWYSWFISGFYPHLFPLRQSKGSGGCWVAFQPQGGSPRPFSWANRVHTFAEGCGQRTIRTLIMTYIYHYFPCELNGS